jgi:hypothetical protein
VKGVDFSKDILKFGMFFKIGLEGSWN